MKGHQNINQLRSNLAELMTSLQQNQKNIDGVRKITSQLSQVVTDYDDVKKTLEQSK